MIKHKCFQGGIVRGTLLAIKYMGLPNSGRGGTVIQTTSLKVFSDHFQYIPIMYKSTKQNVMEFTKCFGVCTQELFKSLFLSVVIQYVTYLFYYLLSIAISIF